MKNKQNYFKVLLHTVNLLALIWLQSKFNFWDSVLIFIGLVMVNYIDGLQRGKKMQP